MATKVLKKNGSAIIKMFQGSEVDELLEEYRDRFHNFDRLKPKSSLKRSIEIFLVFIGLAVSLVLFLISWVTLSLLTHDILQSAAASARTAGVFFGLSVATATALFLEGFTLSGVWAARIFFPESVVVSVGMSYLHLLNRREGIVSGLIISVAFITTILFIHTVFGP